MKAMRKLAGAAMVLALTVGTAACTSTTTEPSASAYPEKGKDLTIIVPVDAGGTTDNVARAIAPGLGKVLGVNVQVINKPGAAQQLGITQLAQSAPDGYTIGFTNLPSMISGYANPARGATYTRESFTPIAGVASSPNVVAVKPDSGIATLDDLVAKAKAGTTTAAITGGALGDDDLILRRIQNATGAKFNTVPFDSGTDKMLALLGGRVDFIVGSVATVLPQVQNGQLKIISLLANEKNAQIPDVPLSNIGYDATAILTISGPKGMAAETATTLEKALKTVVEKADVKAAIDQTGSQTRFVSAADTASFWQENDVKITEVISQAQAK